MTLTGTLLIGGAETRGTNGEIFAIEATSGDKLPVSFGGATETDLEQAASLAWAAFQTYRETPLEERAMFLETIGANILDLGDALVERAMAETGLPKGRIEGERMRTVNQLRMFAAEVRSGRFLERRADAADPARTPPKPDLKLRNIPVGPVAVFGASNFPLAFSVAGGDTASALAAGCPVIVKAHSAHPGTSELVGRAVARAVADCGMPAGTFALLHDSGRTIGQGLVADRRIRAVGFTGSRGGGTALMKIAAARPQPIPVYAEMSSINPVILLPEALKARGASIGTAFVGSLTLGAGQFCTNPGLIVALEGEGLDAFRDAAKVAVERAAAQTMLTPGICNAFVRGTQSLNSNAKVRTLAIGMRGSENQGQAVLFETTAADFLSDHTMQEEMFGAASLVVKCKTQTELFEVLSAVEGQLTAAIHLDDGDKALAVNLIPELELLAGRVLVNGFGTGVEVSAAMVHGGPYPSTSDGRSTSVGTMAIYRFLRPVCYQDIPADLLPVLVSN
ncbi:2,5-dioxovalerate dehydrogenase [Agrobacterium deltaense]|uniref:aldehyde dehydrogenase (NADP(+)) n=1 Tax=Agrobacterium deltaense TaxID=1183412 RepID=UPI000E77B5F2|nr:aldehyde dehydrogenase (NADP(+)) [Agrobacterium deltaense]RKF41827.1 2,5-dioxovalerate dehydrogenase [Agrobacterium deltaense]